MPQPLNGSNQSQICRDNVCRTYLMGTARSRRISHIVTKEPLRSILLCAVFAYLYTVRTVQAVKGSFTLKMFTRNLTAVFLQRTYSVLYFLGFNIKKYMKHWRIKTSLNC